VRAALALVLLVLASGCSLGGDDGGSIQVEQLKDLVLQPADVGKAFRQFDEGRQASADTPGQSRSNADRFGRQEGWKARYHRSGTPQTKGPLVIESRVDLFESSDGAEDELDAAEADAGQTQPGWQPLERPPLGDDARAMTALQGSGRSAVRHYLVIWREANVTGSVLVNGFERRMDFDDALALARKQARRITEAAAS
jgi:hypothetical protein